MAETRTLNERFCRELEYQGFAEGLFIKKDGTVLRAKQ